MAEFEALPESERDLWVARWEIGAEKCGSCGRPRVECGDKHRRFYPQRRVCFATMEREAAEARYRRLHEGENRAGWHDGTFTSWAKNADADHPYHFMHGVTIWVADQDLAPDDDFLSEPDF